jgi:hypothetical protein
MAEIYKLFTGDDIVPGDVQTVSQPIWSENINPLSASATYVGVGFFTSSTQMSQSGDYYMNVYHRNPQAVTNAEVQFAIAYGHRQGSGSYGDPNTVGNNANDTPTRAIYSQYRNMLLPPTDTVFTINSSSANEILVINVARARFRQKIDPGNWELRIGSGSISSTWNTAYFSFIDASGQGESPTVNEAGRVFGIYSGSGTTTASNTQYGLFYPDQGVYVFHAGLLRGTGASALGIPFNSSSAATLAASALQPRNHVTMSLRISGSTYFAARSEENVTSTHYFVRVTNKQFNFSNNPTFVTGSTGTFLHSSMLRNPSVYITTIGMYDDRNRLVAVAKLSKPLLKSFNREALIKVKLDY